MVLSSFERFQFQDDLCEIWPLNTGIPLENAFLLTICSFLVRLLKTGSHSNRLNGTLMEMLWYLLNGSDSRMIYVTFGFFIQIYHRTTQLLEIMVD